MATTAIEDATAVSAEKVSARRWIILALLFALTVINFIDRQTVSVLAPVLREAFHLSNAQYGRIVAAFQFGMMGGELPMGAIMDRWGVRLGLMSAVLWWSGATGFQALARSGTQLGLTRFWMGTGECGNFSGGVKLVSRLFSRKERTLAIGIFNSGSMVGATVAPPLIVFLLHRFGYRAAFLVSAGLGLLWIPLWLIAYRKDAPAQSDLMEQAAKIKPLSEVLRDSSAWAVMVCRFFIGPVMQFYWYWIPSYLFSARHLSLAQIGFVGWIPFLLGDLGGLAGGWSAGVLQRRGTGIYSVRRITMYGSAAVCLSSLLITRTSSTMLAFLLIGVAMLADNFLSANMFAAITDLFDEQQVGRVTGLTGVASGLSGLLFPLLTGILVDRFSYAPVFFLIAFMPLLGTIALFAIGHRRYAESA